MSFRAVLLLVGAFTPTPALAAVDQPQETVVPAGTRYATKPAWFDLQAGVGVNDFNGKLNNNVSPGLSWDLRGSLWNYQLVGGELAYTGAANGTRFADADLGPNVTKLAVSTAGDAQARVNFTHHRSLQPFMSAGVGVLNLAVRDRDTTVHDGTALTLPLSAGVEWYVGSRVSVGGRLNYRVLTDVIGNDLPGGDEWNLGVNVGGAF